MNTAPVRHKTFADVPAANSGAAVGLLAGAVAGLLPASEIISLSGVLPFSATGAAYVAVGASVGAIVGSLVGWVIDHRRSRASS